MNIIILNQSSCRIPNNDGAQCHRRAWDSVSRERITLIVLLLGLSLGFSLNLYKSYNTRTATLKKNVF